jgi:hypothetical protein
MTCSFLFSWLGLSSGVESKSAVMVSNLLDEVFLSQVSQNFSGNGSVHLELVTDNGNSEIEELGSFLGNSFVSLSIKEDSVVKLFLYLGLGPALLLCLSTLLVGGCCLTLVTFSFIGTFAALRLLLGALKE